MQSQGNASGAYSPAEERPKEHKGCLETLDEEDEHEGLVGRRTIDEFHERCRWDARK